MASIDEIRGYLELYPEEHTQRWRLAKKLYNECHYMAALEQLKILREVWPTQLPVLSYLAATYYRMGKYELAEAELTAELKKYPREFSILKHLAKLYEEMGQMRRAQGMWRRILEIRPSKIAEENISRLALMMASISSGVSTPVDHDALQYAPDDGDTVSLCPFCAMKNDLFNTRCIGCHAVIGSGV